MYLELFLTSRGIGMVLRFIIGQMQLFQNDIGMKKVSLKKAESYDTNGKWDWRRDEDGKSYFNN